jgi:DNA polymerase-3 subunit gamma/tau
MSYIVLARKYRPKTFSELVGQSHVVTALSNALITQRLHHAYLFTGTRGVGKTTISRILAKSLNCEKGITAEPCGVCDACVQIDAGRFVDYTELDAASNRGVDEVQQLLEQAVYKPVQGRFKVFMIDEVHMLTNHAFNSMLKTLEEPPEYLKFVLATTDPQKVPVTVLSRCLQFNLRPMAPETILEHLQGVLGTESVSSEVKALHLIAQSARGSMRDALSLTDQAIAFGGGELKESNVRLMLGSVDFGYIFDLIKALSQANGNAVFEICENIRKMGINAASTLEEMARVLQRMAVVQNVPNSKQLQPPQGQSVDPDADNIATLAGELPPDETQLLYSMCLQGRQELGLAPDEYTGLTMIMLRLLAFKSEGDKGSVVESDFEAQKKTLKTDNDAKPRSDDVSEQVALNPSHPSGIRTSAVSPSASSLPPVVTLESVKSVSDKAHATALDTKAALSLPVRDMSVSGIHQNRTEQVESSEMIPVSVHQQTQTTQALEIPRPGVVKELVMTAEGDFWSEIVFQLVESNLLHGLNRELALQSQLLGRESDAWILRVESENLNVKNHKDQLQVALKTVGYDVSLQFEIGVVKDSPARRNIANNLAREKELLERIQNDPLVIKMVQEFDAKIIMGSIKPIEPTEPKHKQAQRV